MEQKILEKLEEIAEKRGDRREFLKQAGKAAVAVPAVALLLSANATPAAASGRYGRGGKKKHKTKKPKKHAPKLASHGGSKKVGVGKAFGLSKH